MEYYEKYLSRLETEGANHELLKELQEEAVRSLEEDPPQMALTITGQMISALRETVLKQSPLDGSMIQTIGMIAIFMVEFLEKMSWQQRAIKTPEGWIYQHPPK